MSSEADRLDRKATVEKRDFCHACGAVHPMEGWTCVLPEGHRLPKHDAQHPGEGTELRQWPVESFHVKHPPPPPPPDSQDPGREIKDGGFKPKSVVLTKDVVERVRAASQPIEQALGLGAVESKSVQKRKAVQRQRSMKHATILPGPRTELSQTYFTGVYQHRILVGIPTMGTVRIEWHNAVNGLVIPVNWSNSMQTPIGFRVDDAQNIVCKEAIDRNFEWVLFLEDDVIPPPDLLVKIERHMASGENPVVAGLYPLKSTVPTPFIFRGRGNGAFTKFKTGDLVWADGVPTGCTLIHVSLVKELAKEAEEYILRANHQQNKLKRIFWTPRQVFADPAQATYQKLVGTSDLFFCDQLREKDILTKAGWSKHAKKTYPYLVDTGINCGHIDRQTAVVYQIGATGDQLR